ENKIAHCLSVIQTKLDVVGLTSTGLIILSTGNIPKLTYSAIQIINARKSINRRISSQLCYFPEITLNTYCRFCTLPFHHVISLLSCLSLKSSGGDEINRSSGF